MGYYGDDVLKKGGELQNFRCDLLVFFLFNLLPSWEKAYFSLKGTFEDDFPFSQVGFVSCLEGRIYMSL